MITGYQVGGGQLIAEDTLAQCAARGAKIARVQAFTAHVPKTLTPPELTTQIAAQPLDHGMHPLVIILDPAQIDDIPDSEAIFIEAGNEPDLDKFGWTPGSYSDFVIACTQRLRALGRTNRLCVGSVSNLNRRGFDFLRTMPWREIPEDVICAYHRYPANSDGPEVGHLRTLFGGRKSRGAELQELRSIIGAGRPIAVSEMGYHELDFPEAKAAEFFAWERWYLKTTGHLFAVAYQVQDGPQASNDYENHFGFRNLEDGTWKAQTAAWTG